jgi:hypothetical protein
VSPLLPPGCEGVWLVLASFLVPVLAALSATGPHENGQVFKAAHTWTKVGETVEKGAEGGGGWAEGVGGGGGQEPTKRTPADGTPPAVRSRSLGPVRVALLLLGVGFIVYGGSQAMGDMTELGLGDVLSNINGAVTGLTFTSLVLSFLVGKSFTVVMSADLMIRLMLSLQRWAVLFPELDADLDRRVAAGQLLDVAGLGFGGGAEMAKVGHSWGVEEIHERLRVQAEVLGVVEERKQLVLQVEAKLKAKDEDAAAAKVKALLVLDQVKVKADNLLAKVKAKAGSVVPERSAAYS